MAFINNIFRELKTETRTLMFGHGTNVKEVAKALEECGGKVTGVEQSSIVESATGKNVYDIVLIRVEMPGLFWNKLRKKWGLEEVTSPYGDTVWTRWG